MKDHRSLGASTEVPYTFEAKLRHHNRLKAALRDREAVRQWCAQKGVILRIKDGCFRFYRISRVAEWWPSSAKLVFNKRWTKGVHAHDWTLVVAEIERRWLT